LCAGVLRRELQVEPEPETKRLYRDLLQETVPRRRSRDAVRPALRDLAESDQGSAADMPVSGAP